MSANSLDDMWTTSDAYDVFMGRWSHQVAGYFIRWLGTQPGMAWLDVGCGTGALASAICSLTGPAFVVACDPSEPFIEHTKRRLADPRVSVVVAGVGDLPSNSEGFDRVVSGLVLNFLPDPLQAVREMRSRACPGGLVAGYVWDYSGRMEFLRIFWDEAVALDRAARELDEGVCFPMCQRDALESIFHKAGLRDVASNAIEIPTRFAGFSDYWDPFLGGTGPAPSYVASLSEQVRTELRDRLQRRVAPRTGCVIDLVARAWAVRGSAP
ncbi:MAG: class I SAM-dependent methyltransferase [Acidobacteriota bacterium]